MTVTQEVELLSQFNISELQLVECCPFRQGQNLIALVTREKLLILYLSIVKDNNRELMLVPIQEFSLPCPCSCIRWGPSTRFSEKKEDNVISLVFGTIAGNVHVLETEMLPTVVKAHHEAINDVAISFKKNTVDPNGTFQDHLVATVGDDCCLKVLSGDREVGRMNFKSPGIRVQWHKQLSLDTLLVAETRGVISIVDWKKKTYLKSLYAYAPGIAGGGEEFFGKEILLDCHWNHLDPYRVGAVIGKFWFMWDFHVQGFEEDSEYQQQQISPSRPVQTGSLEGHQGTCFRWGYRHYAIANINKTIFFYNPSYSNVARALRCGKDVNGISWLGDFSTDFMTEPWVVVGHPNGISVYRI